MYDFLDDIRPGPEAVPDGDYAMWLPSADEPMFTPSETRRNIGRVYQTAAGIETFALAALLGRLHHVGLDVRRVELPEDLACFLVLGPDDQTFALSVSEEKGLRFHFHQSATAAYRNAVLAGFVAYLESLRRAVTRADEPLDEPGDSPPAQWWGHMERVVAGIEDKGEPVQAVGKVLLT